MHQILRPELQLFVYLRERLRVVLAEFDPRPEFCGGVRPLDGFRAEVQEAGRGGGADGGVAGVCQGTGLPVAEARQVVGVAAEGVEGVGLGGSFGGLGGWAQLVAAEGVVDYLPDYFVGGHDSCVGWRVKKGWWCKVVVVRVELCFFFLFFVDGKSTVT